MNRLCGKKGLVTKLRNVQCVLLVSSDHDCAGPVENGNQLVFKNILVFFAAIWYKDKGLIVKNKQSKVLVARKLTSKLGSTIK